MCLLLPNLFFILIGGLFADHRDERRIIMLLHLFAAVPPLLLAAISAFDQISYISLILYALTVGTISAFINPARDSMLNQVAGVDLQRSVIKASGMQFGVQIIGFLVAGSADRVGVGGACWTFCCPCRGSS